MKGEYVSLKNLLKHPGWDILGQLWMLQVTDIEKARDKAAKYGHESAWRYWAGQEKGFKLAMTAVQRAITEMEAEDDNLRDQKEGERIIEEIIQRRPK
jgi:hypothetical protein